MMPLGHLLEAKEKLLGSYEISLTSDVSYSVTVFATFNQGLGSCLVPLEHRTICFILNII